MIAGRLHLLMGIVFRDAAETLGKALDSVLAQTGHRAAVSVLLVDDGSRDDWKTAVGSRLRERQVRLVTVDLGSAARARNFVLDEADRSYPDVDYVCRLDADDVLAAPTVIRDLEAVLERERPDALLAGNWQMRDGEILPTPNLAIRDLLDRDRLLARLARMADGDPAAELPSCNTVVRRGLPLRYPGVASAEDHWYTVSLLLAQDCWKVAAAEGLIYAVYRLHGGLTTQNDEAGVYLRSRKELLVFARRLVRPERCHEPS